MGDSRVRSTAVGAPRALSFDMKIEIVVLPVADVDRAKQFYGEMGWRLDLDFISGADYRVIQFTPPGSGCSIIFGKGITTARPGSAQGHYLVVSDIEIARDELLRRGVAVSSLFHDPGGVFHHASDALLADGPSPERRSYATFASFSDPDGNAWLLQEITARLSGDVKTGDPRFTREVVAALTGETG